MRVGNRPVPQHRPRIAHRHDVILPIRRELLHSGDHASGRHGGAGGKLPRSGLSGGKDFDVRPADIDNQHVQVAASETLRLHLPRNFECVILGTINPGLQLATAFLSAALLEVITAISSFQDLTNDAAPSS